MKPTQPAASRPPLVIACGADDRYSLALGVVLQSLLAHLSEGSEVYLYLLDGGIQALNRQRLARIVDRSPVNTHLEWCAPDIARFQHLRTGGHISAATYLRLLVPDLVPERFAKAIYLDCDLLVEADLNELWALPIGKQTLLAAQDCLIPYVSSLGGPARYAEWGLASDQPYFNAGVLVLNLDRWRAEQLGQRVFAFLEAHGANLTFNDQDALNIVLADAWGRLAPRWNVPTSLLMFDRWLPSPFKAEIGPLREELLTGPGIRHFVGKHKPWHLDCPHPAKLRWRQTLAHSQWFEPFAPARPDSLPRSEETHERPMTTVTIFIPTHNRAALLRTCLESVLAQDHSDFQVVVLDNASTDDTPAIVRAFDDPRITYLRSEVPVGLVGNWQRALELNTSPYLAILPDDDVMLSEFIHQSVAALEAYPTAALSTGLAEYIDADGALRARQVVANVPGGLIPGAIFLDQLVREAAWTIHPATVMLRASALAEVGSFEATHSKQLFDLNLYSRLAARFDLFLFQRSLGQVRRHPGQTREGELQVVEGSRELALTAERIEAVGYLMHSARAQDECYRAWLAEQLQALNQLRSTLTHRLVPGLGITVTERLQMETQRIATVIPPGSQFILVSENTWGPESVDGRVALPFLERDGQYWGKPDNDQRAIEEVERMRDCGSAFIVFSQPEFWWLDYYDELHRYLRLNYPCVLDDGQLVVFDLRQPVPGEISYDNR